MNQVAPPQQLPARHPPCRQRRQTKWQAQAPQHHVLQREQVGHAPGPLLLRRRIGLATDIAADPGNVFDKALVGPDVEKAGAAKRIWLQQAERQQCQPTRQRKHEQQREGPTRRTTRWLLGSLFLQAAYEPRCHRQHAQQAQRCQRHPAGHGRTNAQAKHAKA